MAFKISHLIYDMMDYTVFLTPVGNLRVHFADGVLKSLHFTTDSVSGQESEATRQLREYFSGARRDFDLKLEPEGTVFQKKVWEALLEVPYGETRSYGEIAKAIGNPKAARAVGMANNRNPISIIIPCHRIVGADGSLTGYGGGLDKKTYLLELEQKVLNSD